MDQIIYSVFAQECVTAYFTWRQALRTLLHHPLQFFFQFILCHFYIFLFCLLPTAEQEIDADFFENQGDFSRSFLAIFRKMCNIGLKLLDFHEKSEYNRDDKRKVGKRPQKLENRLGQPTWVRIPHPALKQG
ncbi:MAG: hypothetical protein IJB20_01990 [Clostridia bacterium]|nr:hypothetical protein [Clostridia bacterium]